MYLLLIVTYLLTPVSTFASTLHPIQPNSLQNDDLPNVYNVYNVRNSLPIFQYNNLQDLQQNMDQFLNNINYTTSSPHLFVVQLTDSNSFIFPNFATAVPQTEHYNHQEEEELVGLGLLSTAPQNWIELYGSDIIQQTSIQGIEVQTLSTVDDDSARGEVAYSTGRLQKVSSEYDSKISLYIGFIALIGATSGLTFAPEIEFSTSSSTYYACPVLAGQTVVVKVYPTLTTFTPYTKKLKWNHNLSKFTTKLPFAKLQKASLLTLTGLEDVECFYI
ncbi:hypothetical protein CANMA_001391 [Candida margitis]|uniref:uncharacterized protein n=1 Tax=Candida margitis TaxID=1775924 RepID=UPI002225D612|nr:uncharacterized protein CANMA_001391 [Candida margitis]KAI5969541.1 hypothetical protein CANMA_001391 [Candida margitis]